MAEVVTQIFIKWEFGVLWISQVALPIQEMQGTRVGSRGQEAPLEKEMATHSSILAWEIPWTEEPGGLQSMGSQKSWTQRLNNKRQALTVC